MRVRAKAKKDKPGRAAYTLILITQTAKAGGSLWVQGQPGLPSEFQARQEYTVRHCRVLFFKKNIYDYNSHLYGAER